MPPCPADPLSPLPEAPRGCVRGKAGHSCGGTPVSRRTKLWWSRAGPGLPEPEASAGFFFLCPLPVWNLRSLWAQFCGARGWGMDSRVCRVPLVHRPLPAVFLVVTDTHRESQDAV